MPSSSDPQALHETAWHLGVLIVLSLLLGGAGYLLVQYVRERHSLCYNTNTMSKHSSPVVPSPHVLDFISHSATQTLRIGQRLGEQLQPGDLVLLLGELGVGKTQLVKGIVQGVGSREPVTSPSFVLMNEYRASRGAAVSDIYHIDLYRIEDPAELAVVGLQEIFERDGVCLVEWAEHAEGWIPADHLTVHMSYLDETKRVLRFTPTGARYQELVAAFKSTAFG